MIYFIIRSWRIGGFWALELFCKEFLEDHGIKRLISDELLELSVLFLKQTNALGIADLKATEPLFPPIESALADAVAASDLSDGSAGLGLLEDFDDLFFGVCSFHGCGLSKTFS